MDQCKYLPKKFFSDKLKEIVDKVIQDLGASGKQDFGQVMGKVMSEVKGKAEGNKVREIVEKQLNHFNHG